MEAVRAFDGAPPEWRITLHDVPPPDADLVVSADGSEGDVRFEPGRTQGLLAEVSELLRPPPAVIGVVGSSGGCGATSVALHLAASLAGPVCFLDASTDAAASFRLGIHDDLDIEGAARDEPVPVCGGFRYVAARSEGLAEVLARACAGFESVVVDAPSARLKELAPHVTSAVLLMLPTPSSAGRAAELLALHDELEWAVVTNRLGPGGETGAAELRRIIGRRITLHLPCSPGLRDAEDDDGLLTSGWSPWRRGVERLGRAVVEHR